MVNLFGKSNNPGKNGWDVVIRRDPNSGDNRPMKILFKNGKEIKHEWIKPAQYASMKAQQAKEEQLRLREAQNLEKKISNERKREANIQKQLQKQQQRVNELEGKKQTTAQKIAASKLVQASAPAPMVIPAPQTPVATPPPPPVSAPAPVPPAIPEKKEGFKITF